MVKTWSIRYPSPTGWERRKAYVYLPRGYDWDENASRRYPVLYAFDGHNLFWDNEASFGKSWGLSRYLDRTRTPLIVAALECSHNPDGGRLSEYSPFDFEDYEAADGIWRQGFGHQTLEWFVHKFKPIIDSRFRTIPDREHSFLMGSSFGGVMSLYGVLEFNQMFSRAAVLSPSLWIGDGQLFDTALSAPLVGDTVIYMDYGSEEFWGPNEPDLYFNMASILGDRGIAVTSRIVPWGAHSEASWEKQMPFAIPTLMYGLDF